MKCDCIKVIKEKMLDRFKEVVEHKEIESAKFTGECFTMGDSIGTALCLPFVIRYTRLTKKKTIQNKKLEESVAVSFCPFCGLSVKGGE